MVDVPAQNRSDSCCLTAHSHPHRACNRDSEPLHGSGRLQACSIIAEGTPQRSRYSMAAPKVEMTGSAASLRLSVGAICVKSMGSQKFAWGRIQSEDREAAWAAHNNIHAPGTMYGNLRYARGQFQLPHAIGVHHKLSHRLIIEISIAR